MVTKEDFVAWKLNPVTVAIFQAMKDKIDDKLVGLEHSAGLDPLYDRFNCGMIQAFKDVLSINFDEVEDTDA